MRGEGWERQVSCIPLVSIPSPKRGRKEYEKTDNGGDAHQGLTRRKRDDKPIYSAKSVWLASPRLPIKKGGCNVEIIYR